MYGKIILKRYATSAVQFLLERFPIVGVIGPRQSGKTTLCAQLSGDWKIYDLEKENDFQIIQGDPGFFLEKNPRHVVFDEAQELPSLFPALRVAIDSNRGEMGRFVITGSSSPELLSKISESLAGRIGILELSTFKASESAQMALSPLYRAIEAGIDLKAIQALKSRLSPMKLLGAWLKGGYPAAITSKTQKDIVVWMDNYRTTYLQRDIRRLFPRLNLTAFRTFLSMLSRLSGTIINYAEIASVLQVSQPVVRSYVDIVHGTFVWRKMQAFSKNPKKRVSKMPKGHIRDSGLLHFLLNINSLETLERDPIVGKSWESFVIEEIIKGLNLSLIPYDAYYYRTNHAAEIDLILEGGFGLLPIEIKYGSRMDVRSLRALRDFVRDYGLKTGFVINNASRVEWLGDKIIQIPAVLI